MQSKLHFFGGAGYVTGANFMLETPEKILLDCGLAQGGHYAIKINYQDFEFDPHSVKTLLVSHAHADHIGRIPKLVKDGFSGQIISTPATRDLAKVMFDDALKILVDEAKERGLPPLYEKKDVEKAFSFWKVVDYHQRFSISNLSVEFLDAGHILGSAMIKISRNDKNFIYTGDLGNSPAPLLPDTETVTDADYLLMESVYGDRNHENREMRVAKLRAVIKEIQSRKGTLLIPSFAMQRTQILIYEINKMVESGEIEEIPVYLDSPLASKVTEIYKDYLHLLKQKVRDEISSGDDIFSFPKFTIVKDVIESNELLKAPNPKIIISASGMSVGGRILMHEKRLLENKNNIILFVGYQGAGTLGRKIQDGARKVTINRRPVKIKAQKRTIRGFSAHKDLDNLVNFVEDTAERNKQVFVALGEPKSALFLTQRLREYLGVNAIAPENGQVFNLDF